jgi:hypothetical protein
MTAATARLAPGQRVPLPAPARLLRLELRRNPMLWMLPLLAVLFWLGVYRPSMADPPYLYRPVTQVVRFKGFWPWVPWLLVWLSLPPAPDSCRFCDRAGGSRGAQRPRSGAVGVLDAAARERIMRGGRGREVLGGAVGG